MKLKIETDDGKIIKEIQIREDITSDLLFDIREAINSHRKKKTLTAFKRIQND